MIAPPSSLPSGLRLQKISIPAFQEICTSADVVNNVKNKITNDGSLKEQFNLSIEALHRIMETEVVEEEIGINLKETAPLIHLRAYYSSPSMAQKIVGHWADTASGKISDIIRREVSDTLTVIKDEFDRVTRELDEARDALKIVQTEIKPELLQNQVNAQSKILSQVRNDYKTKKNRLKILGSSLKTKNEQRQVLEVDGLWVGNLRFEDKVFPLPEDIKPEHAQMRERVINARKELVEAQWRLRDYKKENNVEFLNMRYNRKLGILVSAEADLIELNSNLDSTKAQLNEVDSQLVESELFLKPRRAIDADTLLERLVAITSKEDLEVLKDLGVREEIINLNHTSNIGVKNSLNVNAEKYISQIKSNENNILILKDDIYKMNESILEHNEKIKDLGNDIVLAFQVHEDLTGQYRKLSTDIQSLQVEIDALEMEVSVLEELQKEMKDEVEALSEKLYDSNKKIDDVNRDLALKQLAFNDLGPKKAALMVLSNTKSSFCQIAAQAVEPGESLNKSWFYTLVIAGIVGFFISIAVVLAGEYLFKD